jgi:hypothetical protein
MKLEGLQSWAVSKGATHYLRHMAVPIEQDSISHGVILLLEEGSALSLRLAGCLLTHPELDLTILKGALSPGGEKKLGHIVACGLKIEPNSQVWQKLKKQVPAKLVGGLPHWSRFCTHGKGGYFHMGQDFVWVRPKPEDYATLKQYPDYKPS